MKILSNLPNATVTEAPNNLRQSIRQQYVDLTDDPTRPIRYALSDKGFLIERKDDDECHQLLIPLDALYSLAAAHDPSFTPKKKPGAK
jgi:hypothetical protein